METCIEGLRTSVFPGPAQVHVTNALRDLSTVPVLNGDYGPEERGALLEALAEVDDECGRDNDATSVLIPLPAEAALRYREVVMAHLGPNRMTPIIHASLLYVDRKFRAGPR